MPRRVLLRAVLLLSVVLAGTLAAPDVRWWLWGHLRGEAMYRGKPTSYWRGPVKEWQRMLKAYAQASVSRSRPRRPPPPPPPPPTTAEVVRAWAGRFFTRSIVWPPTHDPAAVPVLVQLLSDDDPEVRDYAALTLGDCGPAATAALPGLTEALRDDDPEVRHSAAVSLGGIDRRPEVTVPVLSRMLTDREALVRRRVANLLRKMGPDAGGRCRRSGSPCWTRTPGSA
jgi:hypothetical protein